MARRATLIRTGRAQAKASLVVDAGNSLVDINAASSEPGPRTHGQTSLEILNRLGYDAVALGEKDLLLGKADLLKRLDEAQSFAFLSANLVDKGTGKLLVKPYIVKEIAGHKVALIGITGGASTADFTINPPLDTAREYVKQVETQADVVILLSNVGPTLNKTIAEQVPGIDVIVSGGGVEPLENADATNWKPAKVGKALVVQADWATPGHAGRYIGSLQLSLNGAGETTEYSGANTSLGPEVIDDPDMAAWVAALPPPGQ